MVCEWNYVAGDKEIFDHMARETKKRYPRPYGASGWAKIYKNRFKTGRSTAGAVSFRINLPLPPRYRQLTPTHTLILSYPHPHT
jgi:hypothetical protein